jgi:multiple sugar transport system substrate-binding protein/putative aldouronate transport system substrate-binding protein
MRKGFGKKMLSMLLATSMVAGTTLATTGCLGSNSNEPITLTVYSQVANYSGLQTGWAADIILDKFNVKLNIVPESDGTFQTKMADNDLGDIIIWGSNTDQYSQAVKAGLLYNLEEDDILKENAPYVYENMQDALNKNKNLTATIMDDENDTTLYGWGGEVATSSENHQSFFYTWDTRWDLYKELGYPEVKNMDDMASLLKKMQKLDPKDDSGNKTYAVSLWPDWDDAMVMYVKATATAYYGYDELGIGLYDPATGTYHDALEENGPYLEMLKWYNNLYRDGLVDPNSMTQTYDQMSEKVINGGVLFSIFNYSGSLAFNTDGHLKDGQYMYCMKPSDASPIVYGMSTLGTGYITSIGANCEYPELALEVLNYFCTPTGRLEYAYGPEDECWYIDDDGYSHLTELGEACRSDLKTQMTEHEGTFQDGQLQMAVSTWNIDATNPETSGETYNADNWASTQEASKYDIEQDWKDYTGCTGINDYMEKGKYTVSPGTEYTKSAQSDELKTTWKQVTDCIKNQSWKAIYAKTDAEFNKAVAKMRKDTKGYGYDECLKWSQNEAATRKSLEDQLTQ